VSGAAAPARMPLEVAAAVPPALARPPGGDQLLLVVAVLAVSTSGPLIAACAAPPLAISFWRTAMASGLLVPTAVGRRGSRAELRRVGRRGGRSSLGAGVLLAAHFATWIPSITLTSVASATALVAVQPAWVALLGRAQGQHLPRIAWVGIAVAVCGAALITGVDLTVSSRAVEGDLLALVGGMFAAAYVVVGGVARRTLSTTPYTAVCYLTCAAVLAVVCAAGRQPLTGFRAHDWLLLAAITLGPQLLGHSVFNRVLRTTSATVVSLAILFEVPGATALAWAWLGQVPSALAAPGVLLLLVGIGIVVAASRLSPRVELPD